MVLVVVPVHAVAANELQVLEPAKKLFDDSERVEVTLFGDRVRLGHPHHRTVHDGGGWSQTNGGDLASRKVEQIRVRHVPEIVVLAREVLEPETRVSRVRDHVWTPVLVILNAAHP